MFEAPSTEEEVGLSFKLLVTVEEAEAEAGLCLKPLAVEEEFGLSFKPW